MSNICRLTTESMPKPIYTLPGTSEEVTFKRRPENEETMKRIRQKRKLRHKYSGG